MTTLADEGAGDLTAVRLAESITRHLLHWTHRWQEDGFAPVRMAWNERCFNRRQQASLVLAAGQFEGTVAGLDEDGPVQDRRRGPPARDRPARARLTMAQDFWRSSGWHLLERRDDGRHP